uniref:Apyrase n=1 Tax=Globodera rostochiensis TaxID=31243 RepID=A0A914HLC2_GLORO
MYQIWQLLLVTLLFGVRNVHNQLHLFGGSQKSDDAERNGVGALQHNRLHPPDTKEIQQCLSPDLEEKESAFGRFFAAVIDAGSTGTRLHLFEFSHELKQEPSMFKLENEIYKEIKPGVSCFAKTPELAAENVRELLLTAKHQIPPELWVKTPIAFRATAGVRLLPEKEADAILSEIESEVLSSGLLVDDDAVGMLSGTDEGVFGWFTLNFLLARLDGALERYTKAVAALDLGGGSTQVTFMPDDFSATLKGLAKQKYSHKLKIFDKELKLYTHSYLGNGLVASRLGIAKLSSPNWSPGAMPSLHTHCLPSGFVLDDWDYAGNVWLISASTNTGFAQCMETAKQYVQNVTDVKRVPALADTTAELFLFGYFYDRALQANVVPYTLEQLGGPANVGDFRAAAERACAIPAEAIGPEPWQPWQCLDLTYIYTLLHFGYGLPDEKSIYLTKKLRAMEVSWALGAAFHLLNTYHDNMKRERHEQLQAALARDREELERRRRAVEEREAAADARMAELLNSRNVMQTDPKLFVRLLNTACSMFSNVFHWLTDGATHVLIALRIIS